MSTTAQALLLAAIALAALTAAALAFTGLLALAGADRPMRKTAIRVSSALAVALAAYIAGVMLVGSVLGTLGVIAP